ALRRGEWVTPDGAESWRAMKQRILKTIGTFADKHPGKTIVVATHGGTIKAFVSAFLGVRRTGRGSMRISNGGISVVLRRADHWTLETYNSTAHLTDTPESSEPSGKRLIEAAF
ncbi:MAG TPA: histidine phosphatase family protein, partial [Armatimonadota bacterium]|nr:histidine phosphatase family protein [Armatimonadota bacterium]